MKKVILFFGLIFSLLLVSAGSEIVYSLNVNQNEEEVSTYIPPMAHQLYDVVWVLIIVCLILVGVRLVFNKKYFKKTIKKKVRKKVRKKRG